MTEQELFTRAVENLRRKISWLASKGKISEKLLAEYNEILISLARYFNYSQHIIDGVEEAELEASLKIEKLKEDNEKLRLLLNCTGFPDVFIDEIMQAPKKYLEREKKIITENGNYLQHPTLVDIFRHYLRHYQNKVQSDYEILQDFTSWIKSSMKKENKEKIIEMYFSGFPHLSSFFQAIQEDPGYLSNPYFREHIKSTIENNHLWN